MQVVSKTGLKIEYQRNNVAGGPVVLALHGWLDNLASFNPLTSYLNSFDIIALDLPGHGQSSHKNHPYHFIDGVYDLLDIMDALELESINVLGHSMGAALGVMLAATAPTRVKKLACIDALGPFSFSSKKTVQQMQAFEEARKILSFRQTKIFPNRELAIKARQRVSDLSYDAAALLVERNLNAEASGYVWSYDPYLRLPSAHPFTENQVRDMLEGVKCPILAIKADPGLSMISHPWEERRLLLPQLEFHHLAGGHHIHIEKPKIIADYLRSFFHKI